MNERELQDAVAATARLLGWRIFHVRPARTRDGWRTATAYDGVGFPDLLAVRERLLVAELKVKRNKLTDEQAAWLGALGAVGVEVHIWRESDWLSGVVEAELRREAA